MTSTTVPATSSGQPKPGTVEMKLEVAIIPVTDVDRAKQFYENLGWRLDADFPISAELRVIPFTPTGSKTSIIFGTGVGDATPGAMERLVLVVKDIETARADLVARNVGVSEIFHGFGFGKGTTGRVPGVDPQRTSYGSFALLSDPDGNPWLLQEITERRPGRV